MTFDLVLACDGSVLSTATSPEELDFSAAYPYERWGVVVRYAAASGPRYTKCVARVNLAGAEDYRDAADYAVEFVRDELVADNKAGEFDMLDYLVDGPVIDITFDEPEDTTRVENSRAQLKAYGKLG